MMGVTKALIFLWGHHKWMTPEEVLQFECWESKWINECILFKVCIQTTEVPKFVSHWDVQVVQVRKSLDQIRSKSRGFCWSR